MSEPIKFEPVHGYTVIRAVCFYNGRGFALGENPNAAYPLATWFFEEEKGKRTFQFHRGHYYLKGAADVAALDYDDRIEKFKRDNPGIAERYNYLAAAEMSIEENYNQIDGIPNNGFKPSILEHLRQHQTKPAEHGGTPDKSAGIER